MRLKPIRLVVTLALVILTAPLAAEAQPATKVYRIGNLNPGSPLLTPHLWEAFRQGLRALGSVDPTSAHYCAESFVHIGFQFRFVTRRRPCVRSWA